MLRLPTCAHCTNGARIFDFHDGSSLSHHNLRIRLISHVTHSVNHTLKLGYSLVRTVNLNRSLKRAPFNRTNRHFLGSVCRRHAKHCFFRGIRSIHILSTLCNHGISLRALSNILYRGNRCRRHIFRLSSVDSFSRFSRAIRSYVTANCDTVRRLHPVALRNYIIHVSSVLTCINHSHRSTVTTNLLSPSTFSSNQNNTCGD